MYFPAFDTDFLRTLPGDTSLRPGVRQVEHALWSRVDPTPTASPRLLAQSREMAQELGFGEADLAHPAFARIFGGSSLVEGMQPYSSVYGGHQFGHWAGQLGDGRAIMLGTVRGASGDSWELQLKGAGPTPFSRHADGRAVLRSSIREFICSEAMHHLGIPTTRALSLVATGEGVLRDMFYDGNAALEPGAIVCRAARSFLRFGHFELPAARGDAGLLRQLTLATITRYFPAVCEVTDESARIAAFFAEVCRRTARLVADWMRVGFVHGVLNTDNMSILGLTIDFGPYGWLDAYDPDFTPNTTDREQRRYRFGWQPRIAYWNLGQLARALSLLVEDVTALQAGLREFGEEFATAECRHVASKLGLAACTNADLAMMRELQQLLHAGELDMTLWFRALASWQPDAGLDHFRDAVYSPERLASVDQPLRDWLQRYAARLGDDARPAGMRQQQMDAANPLYIPRNWLAQEVIDAAAAGGTSAIETWLDVLREPYTERAGRGHYAERRPEWARERAGCSTLSCSS